MQINGLALLAAWLLASWLTLCSLAHAQQAPSRPITPQELSVLAGTCLSCHGPAQDIQQPPGIPQLYGRPADQLLQRMLAFKQGQASDATVMTLLMQGYEVEQLQALAQWFALSKER